jgi:hypothetical protein
MRITHFRKSSGASGSWKNAGGINSGPFSLCNSSRGILQCSRTSSQTRRFSAGSSECPTITKRKLCSAHVLLIVCESDVVRTSYPTFSSAIMRTSVRFGSCERTKILSLCVIYVWMPSVADEAFAVCLPIKHTNQNPNPSFCFCYALRSQSCANNDWRCNMSTKRPSRRTDDQEGVWISPHFSLKGPDGERAWDTRPTGPPNSSRFLEMADIALGVKKPAPTKVKSTSVHQTNKKEPYTG